MKNLAMILTLTATLFLCGCHKNTDCASAKRTSDQVLNTPASREEALALMRTINDEEISLGWSTNVACEVRRRMTGRLLAAGMTQKEIDQWIVSPLAINNQTRKETDR